MKQSVWTKVAAALLGGAALTGGGAACGQGASGSTAAIEPEATATLDRMAAYLRTLGAFSLRSVTTIDEVTDDGMKLQFAGTVSMQMQRPNGLRVEVDSDRRRRRLVYDGKTVTLYGERIGYTRRRRPRRRSRSWPPAWTRSTGSGCRSPTSTTGAATRRSRPRSRRRP